MPTNAEQVRSAYYIPPQIEWRTARADEAWNLAVAEAEARAKTAGERAELLRREIDDLQTYIQDSEAAYQAAAKKAKESGDTTDVVDVLRLQAQVAGDMAQLSSSNASRRLEAEKQAQNKFKIPDAALAGTSRVLANMDMALTLGSGKNYYESQLNNMRNDISNLAQGMGGEERRALGVTLVQRAQSHGMSPADATRITADALGVVASDLDPAQLSADQAAYASEMGRMGQAGGPALSEVYNKLKAEEARVAGARAEADTASTATIRTALSSPEWLSVSRKMLAGTELSEDEKALYDQVQQAWTALSVSDRASVESPATVVLDPTRLAHEQEMVASRERLGTLRTQLTATQAETAMPSVEQLRMRQAEIFRPSATLTSKQWWQKGYKDLPAQAAEQIRAAAASQAPVGKAPVDPRQAIMVSAYRAANTRVSSDTPPTRESVSEQARTMYDSIQAGTKTRKDVIDEANRYAAAVAGEDVTARQTARDTFISDVLVLDMLDQKAAAPTGSATPPAKSSPTREALIQGVREGSPEGTPLQ